MTIKTHFKVDGYGPPPRLSWTACGLVGTPAHGASYRTKLVDCKNCLRTSEYLRANKAQRHL